MPPVPGSEIPFFAEFGVALGYVFRCVPGPEVPEDFRAFGLLQAGYAEAAKDVKAALHMFDGFERGMETVAEYVRL